MRVLALNCGSSSVKSALIDATTGQCLYQTRVESIDWGHAQLQGVQDAVAHLLSEYGREASPPEAVAHRVVHGGEKFHDATPLDDAVLDELERLSVLAPLHNPPALAAIRQARQSLPDVPHVAVFDTAFHSTLPEHAREYALAKDVRERLGIRRFGFHGINHAHVASSVAAYLKDEQRTLRIVCCHLGNGASVTAIEGGRSVDTSMGMTPLEGLVMGTRAGDLDPGVLLQLCRSGELGVEQLDELLNERSGLKGLTGSNDMREIEKRASAGDEDCRRAVTLYAYRIRKYIGGYAAAMGGVDVVAFTGGVGENSAAIRTRCLERLDFLGITLDESRNRAAKPSAGRPIELISPDSARVRVLAVRADEELAMAREAARAIGERRQL
jgi:acetate kinase